MFKMTSCFTLLLLITILALSSPARISRIETNTNKKGVISSDSRVNKPVSTSIQIPRSKSKIFGLQDKFDKMLAQNTQTMPRSPSSDLKKPAPLPKYPVLPTPQAIVSDPSHKTIESKQTDCRIVSAVNIHPAGPSAVDVVLFTEQPIQKEKPFLHYIIKVWNVKQDMSQANQITVPSGRKTARITNLELSKEYRFQILAFCQGNSKPTSSSVYTLKKGVADEFVGSGAAKIILDSLLSLSVLFIFGAFRWI